MNTIIGLAMVVSWVWSVFIIIKKTETKGIETVVLLTGFVFILLYILTTN